MSYPIRDAGRAQDKISYLEIDQITAVNIKGGGQVQISCKGKKIVEITTKQDKGKYTLSYKYDKRYNTLTVIAEKKKKEGSWDNYGPIDTTTKHRDVKDFRKKLEEAYNTMKDSPAKKLLGNEIKELKKEKGIVIYHRSGP